MSVSLTVMTFNLLEDQPEDSPNSWQKRRDLCLSVITSYSPNILCTQQGIYVHVFLWILTVNLCFVLAMGDLGQFPFVFWSWVLPLFWILNSCAVELIEQESTISLNGAAI